MILDFDKLNLREANQKRAAATNTSKESKLMIDKLVL
jgi:hypothetical protein